MKYAQFGSISSGTMRAEDLIPAFTWELNYQFKRQPRSFKRAEYRKLINEANRLTDYDSEEADEILQNLFDKLEHFAPPYGYFGAHPGDGADYGFWLSEDFPEDGFDGLRVNDTSEVPSDYTGEVLHVNDHGNMTLYVATRGKLRELWAVV